MQRKRPETPAGRVAISRDLWDRVRSLTPNAAGRGRKPLDPQRIFAGIVHKLKTGRPWKKMPRSLAGSPGALQRHFNRWLSKGLFDRLWEAGLAEHPDLAGIPWRKTPPPTGIGEGSDSPGKAGEIGNRP